MRDDGNKKQPLWDNRETEIGTVADQHIQRIIC